MTLAATILTPDAAKGDGVADDVTALQAFLASCGAARAIALIPGDKSFRLASTGLHYGSNAVIVLQGDLINAHVGPLVGTQHALAGPASGRASNVVILAQGGVIRPGSPDATGSTRKGLGITSTDGFDVRGVQTAGAMTDFNVEVKNSTMGVLRALRLQGANNVAGDDGLHFYGACSQITGGDFVISSGDDSLSFTCEDMVGSPNALMERITLSGMHLNSLRFSAIKFYTSTTTGKATIRKVNLSNITGVITTGPTGCPLMIENTGVAQGCVIEDIHIAEADLDIGAATAEGPCAYIQNASDVRLTDVTLRGRLIDPFVNVVNTAHLSITGEVWETKPGGGSALVALNGCSDYEIDLVVRDATGKRIGTVTGANTKADTAVTYLQMTPA